jgi:hypothetical protein
MRQFAEIEMVSPRRQTRTRLKSAVYDVADATWSVLPAERVLRIDLPGVQCETEFREVTRLARTETVLWIARKNQACFSARCDFRLPLPAPFAALIRATAT